MDLKLVKNLLDLISQSEVDEGSIEEGDFTIKIKKNADPRERRVPPNSPQIPQYQIPPPASGVPRSRPHTATAPGQTRPGEPPTGVGEAEGTLVRFPFVGTF